MDSISIPSFTDKRGTGHFPFCPWSSGVLSCHSILLVLVPAVASRKSFFGLCTPQLINT